MADPASDGVREGREGERGRMSIAERAARRDRLLGDRDRYSSLVRVLQAGREIPVRRRRRRRLAVLDDLLGWNPVGTRLVVFVVVALVVIAGLKLGGLALVVAGGLAALVLRGSLGRGHRAKFCGAG